MNDTFEIVENRVSGFSGVICFLIEEEDSINDHILLVKSLNIILKDYSEINEIYTTTDIDQLSKLIKSKN